MGYNPSVTAAVWVGHDQPRKLGERETGGGLALPIWINYMGQALARTPEIARVPPPGVVKLDGEFYLSETRPGQGVSSLGLDEKPAAPAPPAAPRIDTGAELRGTLQPVAAGSARR